MVSDTKSIANYLEVIDKIEAIRSRNNVNWMDVLRLAFTHAPDEARTLMQRINHEDKRISDLFEQLSK